MSDLWTCLQCNQTSCPEDGGDDDLCDACATGRGLPIHHRARRAGFKPKDLGVGTPAAVSIGGDTYPYTVVGVKSTNGVVREITVQGDREVGPSMFILNPEGRTRTFTRRRDGVFREKGQRRSCQLSIGYRFERMDPSY